MRVLPSLPIAYGPAITRRGEEQGVRPRSSASSSHECASPTWMSTCSRAIMRRTKRSSLRVRPSRIRRAVQGAYSGFTVPNLPSPRRAPRMKVLRLPIEFPPTHPPSPTEKTRLVGRTLALRTGRFHVSVVKLWKTNLIPIDLWISGVTSPAISPNTSVPTLIRPADPRMARSM